MTINVSTFKLKRCKSFQFPVFLLSNIRGSFCSKLDEFQVLFNDNNIDIAILTETWRFENVPFISIITYPMECRIPPCCIVQILTRWLPAEKIFLVIFSTFWWIQPPVSTASSLHPDLRLKA